MMTRQERAARSNHALASADFIHWPATCRVVTFSRFHTFTVEMAMVVHVDVVADPVRLRRLDLAVLSPA